MNHGFLKNTGGEKDHGKMYRTADLSDRYDP